MRFEQAYTPCALCSPARVLLMSGLYPHNHRMLSNLHDRLTIWEYPHQHTPFSIPLREAGYRLGYIGKWHMGVETQAVDLGFHDAPENPASAYDHARPGEQALSDVQTIQIPYKDYCASATCPDGLEEFHETRRCQQGLELIREYAQLARQGHPFFLRIDFPGPHLPEIIPEPYASMYDPAQIEDDPTTQETFENKPSIHRMQSERWGGDKLSRHQAALDNLFAPSSAHAPRPLR